MSEDDEMKIDYLNSINHIFLAEDYISNLSKTILDNNPNDNWKRIAKELNSHIIDLSNSKLFLVRLYQEFEKHAEINLSVKKNGTEQTLLALNNYEKLKKENINLKKNLK